jgi:hypothetical protein
VSGGVEDLFDAEVDELLQELAATEQKARASDLYRQFMALPDEQRRAWAEMIMPSMMPRAFEPMKMDLSSKRESDSFRYRMDWNFAPVVRQPRSIVSIQSV